MTIGALIQARMGSTRLPGKILMELKGKPVLWHVIDRLKKIVLLDEIIVLTTVEEKDDEVEEFCIDNDIKFFRGNEEDVLERYYRAAKKLAIKDIVRITADCPLIDPQIIDLLITTYIEGEYDFYGVGKGFPNGINGAVISFDALEKSYIEASTQNDREHIGEYIKRNKGRFHIGFYNNEDIDMSHHRVTLDTQDDYVQIKKIYDKLYDSQNMILLNNILDYLNNESR